MNKTGKIIVITSGVLAVAATLLIVIGQDKRRKQAYSTTVPPEYAQRIIDSIRGTK